MSRHSYGNAHSVSLLFPEGSIKRFYSVATESEEEVLRQDNIKFKTTVRMFKGC